MTQETRPPRVLVIDDDPPTVMVIERVLSKRGYHVITAPDGADGLKMAVEQRPDIIVLDINMPGLNGYQVCYRLQHNPQTSHIPVLMLTARGSLNDLQADDTRAGERMRDRMLGFDVGAADFLTKPVKAKVLLDRIHALLWSTGISL